MNTDSNGNVVIDVTPGMTLNSISNYYGNTFDAQQIADLNGITDLNHIEIGQKLVLPINENEFNSTNFEVYAANPKNYYPATDVTDKVVSMSNDIASPATSSSTPTNSTSSSVQKGTFKGANYYDMNEFAQGIKDEQIAKNRENASRLYETEESYKVRTESHFSPQENSTPVKNEIPYKRPLQSASVGSSVSSQSYSDIDISLGDPAIIRKYIEDLKDHVTDFEKHFNSIIDSFTSLQESCHSGGIKINDSVITQDYKDFKTIVGDSSGSCGASALDKYYLDIIEDLQTTVDNMVNDLS